MTIAVSSQISNTDTVGDVFWGKGKEKKPEEFVGMLLVYSIIC